MLGLGGGLGGQHMHERMAKARLKAQYHQELFVMPLLEAAPVPSLKTEGASMVGSCPMETLPACGRGCDDSEQP